MSSELPLDAPAPRLCHIIKWPDFEGYGFNLHAEKSKPGQYIGKIDEDSPAELAGLREGDRIIEVNGVNIANENHKQVVERIKCVPNETKLLVVDPEADKWYKEKKIVVKSTQDNVVFGKTPMKRPFNSTTTDENVDDTVIEERMPDMKINDQSKTQLTSPNGALAKSTPPSQPKNGEVNLNHGSTESAPESPHSSNHSQNDPGVSPPASNLNFNMSASEMRKLLIARKKKDPRNDQIDMKEKYNRIQQL